MMSKTCLKTIQECQDFVRGCTVFGTGGGGNPRTGMRLLSEALEHGFEIGWVDVADVPDDAWTACLFGMGTIAPKTEATYQTIRQMKLEQAPVDPSICIQALIDYSGRKIEAMVPLELGGSNSARPIVFGAHLGITTVDGDYAGRAIPEIEQTTAVLAGKPLLPMSSTDEWGSVCIIKEAPNPQMAERLGKMLSVAAFGDSLITGYLMPAREMKSVIVPGTLSKSLVLGRAIRLARERGQDPVQAILDSTGGWLLFQGQVEKKDWEDRDGYMYGTNRLVGIGPFEGHQLDVWFENENHVSWKDGQPFVTSPDLIALVDLQTAEPKTNTDIAAGDRMAVIGMRSIEAFRTPHGTQVLGPRHFGFDLNYVPIEQIMSA